MFVVAVTIFVKPEFVDAFKAAILDNARNTRKEPGNLRFDVLQAESDPAQFFLYEVYKAPEDFASHQQQPHYFRWRDGVADMMAKPRVAVKNHTIFYGEAET